MMSLEGCCIDHLSSLVDTLFEKSKVLKAIGAFFSPSLLAYLAIFRERIPMPLRIEHQWAMKQGFSLVVRLFTLDAPLTKLYGKRELNLNSCDCVRVSITSRWVPMTVLKLLVNARFPRFLRAQDCRRLRHIQGRSGLCRQGRSGLVSRPPSGPICGRLSGWPGPPGLPWAPQKQKGDPQVCVRESVAGFSGWN